MPRLTRAAGGASEVAEESKSEANNEAELSPQPPPLDDAAITEAAAESGLGIVAAPEQVEDPSNPPQDIDGTADPAWSGEAAAAAATDALAEAEDAIVPGDHDVLAGRGASVNSATGNAHFRTLCFQRKPEFDVGNHADKRRIATEIVDMIHKLNPPGRFLKRKWDSTPKKAAAAAQAGAQQRSGKGPWLELSYEKAVQKACQVMRDHRREDRAPDDSDRAGTGGGSAKKKRKTSTGEGVDAFNEQQKRQQEQMVAAAAASTPDAPNPVYSEGCTNGVVPTDTDVLSGRGAFVNAHPGNAFFRTLAIERKVAFDRGNYADKRSLAAEVVRLIRALDPPGRFLKRIEAPAPKTKPEEKAFYLPPRGFQGPWEELSDEKSVHKACQVMRDLRRPDRDPSVKKAAKEAAAAAAAAQFSGEGQGEHVELNASAGGGETDEIADAAAAAAAAALVEGMDAPAAIPSHPMEPSPISKSDLTSPVPEGVEV